jgi:nucleotide-binding universal stress UspA family protein
MSGHAFDVAATLAHDYGARLTVAHVASPPPVAMGAEMPVLAPTVNTKEYLRALTDALGAIQTGYKDVVLDRTLVEGDPATEILALADSLEADFIVMGTHGRTGLGRLLMGSVAEQVSRKAAVPVLLIKNPQLVRRAAFSVRAEKEKVPGHALV